MWKALVLLLWSSLVVGTILYYGAYAPAAARQAREPAQVTAQTLGCNTMVDAALAGRVRLSPRDEAYCATIGQARQRRGSLRVVTAHGAEICWENAALPHGPVGS